MRSLEFSPRRYTGIKTFRWGIYVMARWGDVWHHAKLGAWRQEGMRLDSRKQMERKRVNRHITTQPRRVVYGALRLQVSYWQARVGRSNKPWVAGVMIYHGGAKLATAAHALGEIPVRAQADKVIDKTQGGMS